MNIKENDNLPNAEVFVLEDGEHVKKNIIKLMLISKMAFLLFKNII